MYVVYSCYYIEIDAEFYLVLDNGGCRSDQICELKQVLCVRAPCPPVAQCSCPPPCSKEFCNSNPRGLCSR